MRILVLMLMFSLSWNAGAEESNAKVQIDINQAKTRKSLVALPPLQFLGSPASAPGFNKTGAELFKIIQNDLTVSTYFQFISQSAFLEDSTKTTLRPNSPTEPSGFKFDSWKQIGSEFLIRGGFTIIGDSLTLEIYAYSVSRGTLAFGKKYKGTLATARRIAHTFANDFMENVTGTAGIFLSRVAFSSDRAGNKFREVYIMDWDGANVEPLTNHKSVAISPSLSPDGSKVAYTAFVQRAKSKTRNADLFIYELQTGKRWLVSYRQGLNSGSNFAADGKHIFLTISSNQNPDIYKMTYDGTVVERITDGPHGAMNVEPAISPDGKRLAFSSDRSGQPMIWVVELEGKKLKRITFAGKYNSTPSWSPDGKKLVFAGWESDHFDIFTMDVDGSNMVRITSSKKANGKWANNEDPVFSADGRLLMYTSNRTGNSQIYISNLDGSEERRITVDGFNYFKPRWSKNLD